MVCSYLGFSSLSFELDQVTQHLVGIQSSFNGIPERDLLMAHSTHLASLPLQAL